MLPDFPHLKAKLISDLLAWTKKQVPVISPLIGEVSRVTLHEGERSEVQREDESVATFFLEPLASEFTLNREDLRRRNPEKVIEKLLLIAEHFARTLTEKMLSEVSDAAASVGNVVDAAGKAFSQEHFFEMLTKIRLEFDPLTEEPRLPTFVVHPTAAPKIRDALQRWRSDLEFVRKYDLLLNTKKAEWRDRESRRKLVD